MTILMAAWHPVGSFTVPMGTVSHLEICHASAQVLPSISLYLPILFSICRAPTCSNHILRWLDSPPCTPPQPPSQRVVGALPMVNIPCPPPISRSTPFPPAPPISVGLAPFAMNALVLFLSGRRTYATNEHSAGRDRDRGDSYEEIAWV